MDNHKMMHATNVTPSRNRAIAWPTGRHTLSLAIVTALFLLTQPVASVAGTFAGKLVEHAYFADRIQSGELPPIEERIPQSPAIAAFDGQIMKSGKSGGTLRLLMGKEKDIRMMTVYGYSRLVGFTPSLDVIPDVLENIEVKDNREFTLRLRKGHRWSDGAPFTSEDFKFFWEDVAKDPTLSPHGVPIKLLVDGEEPEVSYPDETTVIYRWQKPNPDFLAALAGARPLYIYAPKHYLKQFHGKYANKDKLDEMVKKSGKRNWAGVYFKRNKMYKQTNPQLPTLEPWINTTKPPSERFVFTRNPYYHRIDSKGIQLPYIDEVVIGIASGSLIPAKTGAGESDLQARHLRLDNVPFLKKGEARKGFNVRLWSQATGSHIALYPNLNSKNEQWRSLVRDVRFRRAMSLLIDREEINQVVYFGLVAKGANTILPVSNMNKGDYQSRWATFDVKTANKLLDEMGLDKRDDDGIRLMPNGEPLEIIIQTAGESTEQTDVLELIHDSWLKGGLKLFSRPSQREVFRDRVYSGDAMIAVWTGIPNGLPTPQLSPADFVPSSQEQYQWPKWGQYFETKGGAGTEPDIPEAKKLVALNQAWRNATSPEEQTKIWDEILEINADQVFTLGIVKMVPQPVVVSGELNNVPQEGVYNWHPGAFFGMYKPETFWFNDARRK